MIKRGQYTLLEVVAAIAILVLVLGVTTVSFGNLRLEKSPLEQVQSLRRMAALCRRSAVAQGKAQSISYVHEQRTIRFGNENMILPETMRLTVNAKVPEDDLEIISFFPDGNSTESVIEISCDGETAGLTVSPLTGVMDVYEKE